MGNTSQSSLAEGFDSRNAGSIICAGALFSRFVAAGTGAAVALVLAGCSEAKADEDEDEEEDPEVEVSGEAGTWAE